MTIRTPIVVSADGTTHEALPLGDALPAPQLDPNAGNAITATPDGLFAPTQTMPVRDSTSTPPSTPVRPVFDPRTTGEFYAYSWGVTSNVRTVTFDLSNLPPAALFGPGWKLRVELTSNTTSTTMLPSGIELRFTGVSSDFINSDGLTVPPTSQVAPPLVYNGTVVYDIFPFRTPIRVDQVAGAARRVWRGTQAFSVSGTFTPSPLTQRIKIKMWGGGAGGSSTTQDNGVAWGGGGGGYLEFDTPIARYVANNPRAITITVGAGGALAQQGTTALGGAGGDSIISIGGMTARARGGTVATNGADGGTANITGAPTITPIAITGTGGDQGRYSTTSSLMTGGFGGASPFGGVGGVPRRATTGQDGSFPGGGGAAGNGSGAGSPGLVIIEEYT